MIKRTVILAIGCTIALIGGSFVYDYFDEEIVVEDDRLVEITGSSIVGYDNGKLNWKVTVDNAWAKKNRSFYYADKILSGVIYDSDGAVLIDSIEASDVKINTKINSITIQQSAKARFMPQKKQTKTGLIANEAETKDPIIIKSDELRYYSNSEKVVLQKGVELIKDSHVIKPKVGAEIDNNDKVAYIKDGFHIESEEFFVSGNNMTIFIDDKISNMWGDLMFERFASMNIDEDLDEQEKNLRKQKSILFANKATYIESEEGNELYATGNIHLIQSDKNIIAEFAYYNEALNLIQLEGNITIELLNLDWALDETLKKKLSNQDIKNSLNQKTKITSNSLQFDGQAKETTLVGDVKITQSDKIILCNKLIMYDETSLVECLGDVSVVKEDRDTIKTDYLEIDLNNETFTAKNRVFSEYYLDEN